MSEEVVFLPDDVRPGNIIECHGVKQRVTYEFGTYALERLEQAEAMRLGTGMAGLAGALGATLSSLCCLLPLAIILLGLGSGAFMAVTMKYQAVFIPLGALSLALGYRQYFRERKRCADLRCRLAGGRLTLTALILSTIVVGAAAALALFPAVTADLLAWAVGPSGSGGTPMGQ